MDPTEHKSTYRGVHVWGEQTMHVSLTKFGPVIEGVELGKVKKVEVSIFKTNDFRA